MYLDQPRPHDRALLLVRVALVVAAFAALAFLPDGGGHRAHPGHGAHDQAATDHVRHFDGATPGARIMERGVWSR